jgi:hypothetical protein
VGGDSGLWGGLLNSDMTYIDEAINQSVTVNIADTNVTLTADGSSSDQARYLRYNFTGALTADRTVTLPANVKVGWASNNTTGGHNVILSAGGTTLSITNSGWNFFYCDGTNVTAPTIGVGGSGQISGANGGVAITGSNTNDSAAAGYVGEYKSSVVASGSAVSLTNNVAANITSLSLTAGDWDVWGTTDFSISSGSNSLAGWINTVSASQPASPNGASVAQTTTSSSLTGTNGLAVGMTRISISTTTTVYLSATASFIAGTVSAFGFLGARRVR